MTGKRTNRKQVWISADLHDDVHYYALNHDTTAKDFVTKAIIKALLAEGVEPFTRHKRIEKPEKREPLAFGCPFTDVGEYVRAMQKVKLRYENPQTWDWDDV